jgi:hypothetical protein
MADDRTGRIWGLENSDAGKALTAAFEPSDTGVIAVTGPTDLVCDPTLTGGPPDSVEFRVDLAINGDDFRPLPSLLDTIESVLFGPREFVWDLVQNRIFFHVPWACAVRLMAKATNPAGSLLNVDFNARKLDGGGGGNGALAGSGAAAGAGGAALDPVTGSLRTSEQAGPETVLYGETLFDETGVGDGTYDYYVEHDGFKSFALHFKPSGAGTKTLTVWCAEQDDGTAIAARDYVNETSSIFSVPSFTTESVLRDQSLARDAKSIRFRVVVSGSGGGANFKGYFKQSY